MRHTPSLLRQIFLAAGVAATLFALMAEGQATGPVCWVNADHTNALVIRGAAQDGDFGAAIHKLLARTCKAGNPLRGYVPYAANGPAGATTADRNYAAYPDWTGWPTTSMRPLLSLLEVPGFVCRFVGDSWESRG